jgi:hypothetical protein
MAAVPDRPQAAWEAWNGLRDMFGLIGVQVPVRTRLGFPGMRPVVTIAPLVSCDASRLTEALAAGANARGMDVMRDAVLWDMARHRCGVVVTATSWLVTLRPLDVGDRWRAPLAVLRAPRLAEISRKSSVS